MVGLEPNIIGTYRVSLHFLHTFVLNCRGGLEVAGVGIF